MLDIATSVNSQFLVDKYNRENGTTPKASSSEDATAAANLNFDAFLKMLTTQLQNQDPLNPMEGTAFTEQIATFSALEQQIATNAHLEKLVDADNFGAQTLAVSYIGKDALVEGLSAELENSEMEFFYELDSIASNVTIELINGEGATVREFEADQTMPGLNQIAWDGTNNLGEVVPDGIYAIKISAVGLDGNTVKTKAYSYGYVDAVDVFNGSVTMRLADGREAEIDDIISIRGNDKNNEDITG